MIRLNQIATGESQPASASPDQPLEHLLACHQRIEEQLAVLERAAAHLGDRREEALDAMANCFRFMDTNGVWHTEDEENSVFPRLRGRITSEEEGLLQALESDHRETERVYRDLKESVAVLSNQPRQDGPTDRIQDLVERLCGLYREHIKLENARLIAVAQAVFRDEELSAIGREMKMRRGLAP